MLVLVSSRIKRYLIEGTLPSYENHEIPIYVWSHNTFIIQLNINKNPLLHMQFQKSWTILFFIGLDIRGIQGIHFVALRFSNICQPYGIVVNFSASYVEVSYLINSKTWMVLASLSLSLTFIWLCMISHLPYIHYAICGHNPWKICNYVRVVSVVLKNLAAYSWSVFFHLST